MSLTLSTGATVYEGGEKDSMEKNIVLTFPLKADNVIVRGDFLDVDASGWFKNVTNEAKVKGIAMNDVDSTGLANGEKTVAVMLQGVTKVDALVQDTDGASGYDGDIAVGQAIFVGGDAGTLVADGQGVVAGDGTNPVTANQFGTALEAEAGSTAADTLGQILVFFDGMSAIV